MDTNSRLDAIRLLRKLEFAKGPFCCIHYSGGSSDRMNLNKYLNGYGRIVKHFSGEYDGWHSEFLEWIYEGEFRGGYD